MADLVYVYPNLAVGGGVWNEHQMKELADDGITHIIDAQGEFDDTPLAAKHNIQVCWCPAFDNFRAPSPVIFEQARKFVVDKVIPDEKAKLFVHCFIPGMIVGDYIPYQIEEESYSFSFDHEGVRRNAVNFFKREYEGYVYRLKARGTLSIVATPEHPFLVLRPHIRGKNKVIKPTFIINNGSSTIHQKVVPKWMSINEIKKNDYLCCPPLQLPQEAITPAYPIISTHGNTKDVRDLECNNDLAWLFGMYVANGSATENNGDIQFCVKHDNALVDRIKNGVAFWGLEINVKDYDEYYRIRFSSVTLARSFREWFGADAYTKHFPEWLFSWNLKEVISGYKNGDGYLDKRRTSGNNFATTSSWRLAQQLFMILVTLGECPYVNLYERETNFDCERAPAWSVGWTENGTHSENFWWNEKYWVRVESNLMEPYKGVVYNRAIPVSNSYLINGIATHNCAAGVHRGPMFALLAASLMGHDLYTAAQRISLMRHIASFPVTYYEAVKKFVEKHK